MELCYVSAMLYKTIYDTESIVSSWKILNMSKLKPLFLDLNFFFFFLYGKRKKYLESMQWSFDLNNLLPFALCNSSINNDTQ